MAKGSTSRSRARHAANVRHHGKLPLYVQNHSAMPTPLLSVGFRIGNYEVTKIMPALTGRGWAVRITNLTSGEGETFAEESAIKALLCISLGGIIEKTNHRSNRIQPR